MSEKNSAESFTSAATTNGQSVGVVFSPEQFQKIQSLADKQGVDPAVALAQAIDIANIVVDAEKTNGKRVLIQTGDKLEELTTK